ncbi:MAG: ABC transporter ATP-binding protein/permease [Pelosinus sp.]|nr:ABC transporter ATP-binding protein/permease [Pelosinus sp.]
MKMILVYFKELYNFAPLRFVGSILLMAALGLLEGAGVIMIIPLLGVAGIIPGISETGIMADVSLFLQNQGIVINLPIVLLIYLSVNLGQSLLQRYQALLNADMQQGYCQFLAMRLFKAIAYAEWQLLMKKAKSDIMNVLFSELIKIGSAVMSLMGMLATVLITVIQVILAVMIAPALTGAILLAAAVLFFAMRSVIAESRRRGHGILTGNRDLFNDLTEHLNGIKEIKSYSIETAQVNNFNRLYGILKNNSMQYQVLRTRSDMWYKMGSAVFICLFLFIAIEIFKLRPDEFVLITVISSRLWPRFSSLQAGLQNLNMLLPSFEVVEELERQCLTARENLLEDVDTKRLELTQCIELRDVSFRYGISQEKYALKHINFTLPVGTTTALVGVSGAGKSTLVDILIGLLVPQQGAVLIDGKGLANNLRAWRSSIGYVSQDPFLLNASIRENLLWATPNASEEEMWDALSLASAEAFVRSLPDGLATVVGDRGVRLSGGERQRIVLARALLRKPSILILDEATSSLDSENERRIQQAIDSLQGKLTIVVIAHRISTIRNADQIYVLEQGKIIEHGNYHSLLKNRTSRFYSLASLYAG